MPRHNFPDTTQNSSNKSWTVPGNSMWHIDAVWVHLAATATVGSRQVMVYITDTASQSILVAQADTIQAASSTGYYFFTPDMPLDAGFTSERLRGPLWDVWVRPGCTVTVKDNAAIDAAADDMEVSLFVTSERVLS